MLQVDIQYIFQGGRHTLFQRCRPRPHRNGLVMATRSEERADEVARLICRVLSSTMPEERSADGCNLFFIYTDTFHDQGVTVPIFHDSQDQRFQRLTMLLYQEFLLQEAGWQKSERLYEVRA